MPQLISISPILNLKYIAKNGIFFITDGQKDKPISRFERPSNAMLFVTEQKQFLGLICFQICKERKALECKV